HFLPRQNRGYVLSQVVNAAHVDGCKPLHPVARGPGGRFLTFTEVPVIVPGIADTAHGLGAERETDGPPARFSPVQELAVPGIEVMPDQAALHTPLQGRYGLESDQVLVPIDPEGEYGE